MSSRMFAFGAWLLLLSSCRTPGDDIASTRVRLAEQFFRGVYGGDSTVVDELASTDVVVSYPIFQKLFGTPTVRGHDAVRNFAVRFGKKWADPEIRIDETVSDTDRVVLVWSFRARDTGGSQDAASPSGQVHEWGGISLFRFDKAGKIVAEIGEESEPGPFGRLADAAR